MTAAEPLTDAGGTVGTIGYMAPEQVRGEAADQRADIFALGVVLYEMATGKQPFGGGTTGVIFDAILNRPPVSPVRLNPQIPLELERVINTALEKDPELRYQSAAELRAELKRLVRDSSSGTHRAAPGEARKKRLWAVPVAIVVLAALVGIGLLLTRGGSVPSTVQAHQVTVAVLPFQNMTGDASLDYLKLALPDEVSTSLSYAAALAVRPQATTRRYDRADVDIDAAARELRVGNIITGQVSREGAQLRVALEAIEIEGMRVRWRDSIAVDAADLISLRERLASRVRQGLLPVFGQGGDAAPGNAPTNAEAYDLYLRATALSSDNAPNREGIALLERSVALDANFASAWAELGRRLYIEGNYGGGGRPFLERSEVALKRALGADPALVAAKRLYGVQLAEKGDLVGAYDQARDLIRTQPQSGNAHFLMAYVLRYAGLLDESARECEIAYQLDPNPGLRSCAVSLWLKGDYARAHAFLDLERGSEWVKANLPALLLREGRYREAAEGAGDRQAGIEACVRGKGPTEMVEGIRTELANRIDSEPRYHFASLLSFCGQTDAAIELLTQAIAGNYCSFPMIETDPLLANVRKRPEYARLKAAGQECQQRFLAQRRP
jgi:TolB-like protein